ncbi:MAG: PID-CTERM protein-sorting domain-containing protein [Flavobacteriales bacterium]
MKLFKLILLTGVIFGVFFLLPEGAFAQPGGGGTGGGDDPGCWPPPCVPIDGGIGWLVAAGAIYGGRKAYKSSRKDPASENE